MKSSLTSKRRRPQKKKTRAVLPAPADAAQTAKDAGLRYVSDEMPGIRRENLRGDFRYRLPGGAIVRDAATLGRIKSLAIPPAWTEVWICPGANGHIQATGRDARGRKQYRYHPHWRAARDETKYERMIAFGKALPAIRRRVARDLKAKGLGRTKVLAAMVQLLETTLIRIGNEEYAKQNRSFGLSTMRDKHVSVGQGTLHFEFRGKSGKSHEIDLHEPRLAAIVRQTQDLPGQELFQYLDENGERHTVSSEDVNAYLREIAGEEFSAKDFRTWAGTVLMAIALREFERFDTKTQAKKNLVAAIEKVAERLGNTPAVCRKCYVHPVVMDSYLAGETVEVLRHKAEDALRKNLARLDGTEAAVLAFLEQKLRQPKPSTAELLQQSIAQARTRRAA
jgi:DNA topoisomerase-1